MPPTLTEPLSGALHELLTARCLRERNKEIALALVAAGNRGEAGPLTRHWPHPGGLQLTCENIVADGEWVALRVTVRQDRQDRQDRAAWVPVGELRLDAAGRIVDSHQTVLRRPAP